MAIAGASEGAKPNSSAGPIEKALEVDVWLYVAMNTIAKAVAMTPLLVERPSLEDGDEWETVTDGELYDLVNKPNEVDSPFTLVWRTVLAMTPGDAYWFYDTETPSAPHLYHIPTSAVKVRYDGKGITGYEIEYKDFEKQCDPNVIIHFSFPNPSPGDVYGLSPVEPVKLDILLNRAYKKWIKDFFDNGAIPTGALATDEPLTDEDIATIRQQWETMHGGEGNHHRLGIFGKGLSYEDITPPIEDLLSDMLIKMPREAIFAAHSMPPVLGGIFEYANYANSKEQIGIFWENGVMPFLRLIEGAINAQLAPQIQEGLRVRFDTSDIKALQEDEETKQKKLCGYVSGGIMTPNEARSRIGLDPDENEESDQLRGDGFNDYVDVTGDDMGLGQPSRVQVKAGRSTRSPREKRWFKHFKTVKKAEERMEKTMRRYFNGQLVRVLTKLRAISTDGKINQALLWARMERRDDNPESDQIFSIIEENLQMEKTAGPVVRKELKKAGDAAALDVGFDWVFSVTNPKVKETLLGFKQRMELINDKTYDMIKDVLAEAYDTGAGIKEVEKSLREMYQENFSKARAKRIAVTEMNGVVNGGSAMVYEEAGVKQEWICAFLAESRESHIAADAQVVGPGESFMVDGELLKHPGDPGASAGNVVNCHCAVAPVI